MDEQTREDREYWDRMAPTWERWLPLIGEVARPVAEWLVSRADPAPGRTLLDVAAGAGDVGFLAAPMLRPDGKLITGDLSPAMVEVARRRAAELEIDADVRVLDAQALDLPDDSVDAIVSRFGYMLVPDPERALSEARRVLRPAGRLAFAVWGAPERNPWVVMLGMLLLQRGRIELEDPMAPGGMFSMATRDLVEPRLSAAGLSLLELEEIPLAWPFPDFETFWRYESELLGPLGEAVREMPPQEAEDVRAELERLSEGFRVDEGYEFPAVATCVLAR